MDEKFTEAITNRPQGERTLDAPLVTIDLRLFIAQIKEEEQWKNSDRNAITIFKRQLSRFLERIIIFINKGSYISGTFIPCQIADSILIPCPSGKEI